ncbi:sugar phosphate isomerase/epimerase family protein [Cohnella luojiensis]|uniref:Sugar phosphate isomerase/epimerase n=1 Tax=Cohnella luojiensis TaxID=652876 RepID=A0A4Y8M2G6_9BACL|nr:sugar phosphate isomerase/epimerase [Cohnella luojiensis]TFE28669.1 sugar phosphate isomerase/epimerase [Cohnella luojiensis]
MKLSVFTVSTPELDPGELTAAAKQAGIKGIEWRYKETPQGLSAEAPSFWGNNRCTISPAGGEEELDRFKRAAERNGMKTISVTPYLQAGDLAATEQVLRAARYLGASFIRVGVPGYDRSKPFNELFEHARTYLKNAEALCKQYGIKGLVEIHHGTLAASASGARRLVEDLDPSFIGVLFDPGNSVHEGFENYRMSLEILGPYLAHVHVKNAGWKVKGTSEDGNAIWQCEWAGLKEGMVPWKQVIADLVAVGYDGYLGVEDFSKQFPDSADMMTHFAEYMRGILAEHQTHV